MRMSEWLVRVLVLVKAVRSWQSSADEMNGLKPGHHSWLRAAKYHGEACYNLEEALRQLDLADEEEGGQDVEW